jgi:hypothetical protein
MEELQRKTSKDLGRNGTEILKLIGTERNADGSTDPDHEWWKNLCKMSELDIRRCLNY